MSNPGSKVVFALAVIVTSTVGCAASEAEDAAESDGALAAAPGEPVPRSRLPEPQAFIGWTDDTAAMSPPRPEAVRRTTIACADKKLYPTHPSSDLKRYHWYAHGRYDHNKLTGESDLCVTPGRGRNAAGQVPCLRPDGIEYAMLSDTYVDACGNYYRGFWDELYVASDETMGTLMSKGRRVYEKPRSQFRGDVYDDGTYAVDAKTFAFVAPLLPGDKEAVATQRQRASTTHRYDPATKLFVYVGPYR